MKVVHVIAGLEIGGAERMLVKLVTQWQGDFDLHVVSLTSEGPICDELSRYGATVHPLGWTAGAIPSPNKLLRLVSLLRKLAPNLVQTWMYHSDLIGGIAARLATVKVLVWNIRASELPETTKLTTRLAVHASARLSKFVPDAVVCCSQTARLVHEKLGYDMQRIVVIPNGFDMNEFKPDNVARQSVRQELEIPAEAPLIGQVARFDPLKNHQLFFSAAKRFAEMHPDSYFLLAGREVTWQNAQIRTWAESAGISPRTRLLGQRRDVPRLTAALDLATSSSWTEGFPNALGEALSCGIPCVATDVGDSALIVRNAGRIVSRDDPAEMANAWLELLKMPAEARHKLGEQGRAHIAENYDIRVIARRYAELYTELTKGAVRA